ncbi:hypothetical protein [Streptomyces sp. ISL-86]|uniref:hypothetical protein n=1 Tax=Streptomyces sp. ISL-86 TaxID=2819187 RepID=UPI001BE8DFDA|nr:hypothetical protein [Streptomyces sp. ISL-86]MBT2455829.1 hypothetical protein [Streptomyces sp. ISL-86]
MLITLDEFKHAIQAFRREVDTEVVAFVRRSHPYPQGTEQAATRLGACFTWTMIHRDALLNLASDLYGDFLRRSE